MLFRSTMYWVKDGAYNLIQKLFNKIKRILSAFRVQKPAHYTSTTRRVFKKDCMESGILPEMEQKKPPPYDDSLIIEIKAFNQKLKSDLIRQRIGR